MPVRLAVFLCNVSPTLRRVLWRWWYGRLARRISTGTWTCMNYGFTPAEPPAIELAEEDEADRFCLQLYQRVVSPVPLGGARVLEVGCGRGGGASYLARYHRPAHLTGLDFSRPAIAWCRQRHHAVKDLFFVVGDAEQLPFPDGSFDVVINIESSHCYGHIARFFREAGRVLRPGGHILFADVRSAEAMPALEAAFVAESAWELVDHEDLTTGVQAALERDNERKLRLIGEHIPPKLQRVFGEFAALTGTEMYRGFLQRRLLYHRFAGRKRVP